MSYRRSKCHSWSLLVLALLVPVGCSLHKFGDRKLYEEPSSNRAAGTARDREFRATSERGERAGGGLVRSADREFGSAAHGLGT